MYKINREDLGKKGRFVILDNDEFAGEMTFTWAGEDRIIIDHTGVQKEHGGKGLGKKLVLEAVTFARQNEIKILPLCPFAKRVLSEGPEYKDILF